jgi:hypothetical protein
MDMVPVKLIVNGIHYGESGEIICNGIQDFRLGAIRLE